MGATQTKPQTDSRESLEIAHLNNKYRPQYRKSSFQYLKKIQICDQEVQIEDDDPHADYMFDLKKQTAQYALLELNMEKASHELQKIESIKVKWNSFIKMKTRNYLDDYLIVREIGKGGFGTVCKVKAKFTGVYRAAKKIKKSGLDTTEYQKLFAEMAIMTSLDHPHLAKLFEVYDYKSHYVLILELCQGGELFKKIVSVKQMKENYAATVMKQLIKALIYLHAKKIVHRDLKPENILFEKDSQQIKIIDFGIALQKTEQKYLTERLGTPYYVAPQVLLKKYDEKCDLWSAGIILYMMLSRRPPFKGENQIQVMENILNKQVNYSNQMKSKYSADCIDFLQKLLVKNPNDRMDATQAFHHPWLANLKENGRMSEEAAEILTHIERFKFKNKLEAVVYTYICSQVLTTAEKADIVKLFESLDINHDGVLSTLQLRSIISKNTDLPEQKIKTLMRVIDTNSSGYIDLTEFIVAVSKLEDTMRAEHFEQAFEYFDMDHSGAISYEEIAYFLQDSSQSTESIKKIFQQIDVNGDGQISRSEFVQLLMKHTKERIRKLTAVRKSKILKAGDVRFSQFLENENEE